MHLQRLALVLHLAWDTAPIGTAPSATLTAATMERAIAPGVGQRIQVGGIAHTATRHQRNVRRSGANRLNQPGIHSHRGAHTSDVEHDDVPRARPSRTHRVLPPFECRVTGVRHGDRRAVAQVETEGNANSADT